MKPRFTLLLAAGLAAAAASAAEFRPNIVYGRAGGVALRLDADVPDAPGPHPVAILVHGGGWSSGNRTSGDGGADISPWFAPLTEAGFTWFSIDYRLAPAHRWPAGIEDLKTAIRWVKAHAPEFKGDPSRIALVGHSAGGHMVCYEALAAGPDTRVQAVVGCAPVTDLVEDSVHRGGLSLSLQYLFGLPKDLTPGARAILAAASPIDHVAAGAPPFLLIQGGADRTVPYYQTLAFKAKLDAAGVPCRLIAVKGAPHSMVSWDKIDPSYKRLMIEWLRSTLGGQP